MLVADLAAAVTPAGITLFAMLAVPRPLLQTVLVVSVVGVVSFFIRFTMRRRWNRRRPPLD
ncbi:MAG: hypothetical protein B5766_08690 [Candidatus Lumbricidophila eiseniae]|uniref:Uncharacterized protein n=1 Tax=Candidatus Lumbricidiphila eiseniae TaxID=1969409 RepID=A0A2A6FQF1_9MICO|nr:MAG: hypothetical protein B5766_08690 [Candidatus Lumbricidophila eiseniae]